MTLPPVYPITDKRLAGKSTHYAIVRELVRGGALIIQARDKATPPADLLEDLRRCREFCQERNVLFIVNDRCDLALCSGAAGVHLGQDDLPPSAARSLMGTGRIIGWSACNLAQVRSANRQPVDYIGFGPVFPTATKENAPRASGLTQLKKACREAQMPMVAIGGIGLDQLPAVLRAGAASAAVISALMTARSIAREMEIFLKAARATGWNGSF